MGSLKDLESILLPPRVECVDGVLQVVMPGMVLARQACQDPSATASAHVA
jgi:hypothetical protein